MIGTKLVCILLKEWCNVSVLLLSPMTTFAFSSYMVIFSSFLFQYRSAGDKNVMTDSYPSQLRNSDRFGSVRDTICE